MQRSLITLRAMTRPQKLIQAATFGLNRYRRERHMATLLKSRPAWTDETFLTALIEEEEYHNELRELEDANYNLRRHIHVLIAVVAEAHSLMRPRVIETKCAA